jgi:tRNA U34 5-methylaminomethyl-2-thiouridine-forming methyltransferase MnmC
MSWSLKQTPGGHWTLRDEVRGETFHPELGPEEEARVLYLDQMGFPGLWEHFQNTPLIVWDCGLGAAANACMLLQSLQQAPDARLELHSFDLTTEPLELARRHAGQFPWLDVLREGQWEELLRNHSLRLRQAFWRWHLGDFTRFVQTEPPPVAERPHLLFYDFHSPAKDYALWTLDHWKALRRWCREGATPGDATRIVLHSRSTALRATLLLAGFYVGPGTGIGSKEETTLAAAHPGALARLLDADWLRRAGRSTSAQPFTPPAYAQAPLDAATAKQLAGHPQFCLSPG